MRREWAILWTATSLAVVGGIGAAWLGFGGWQAGATVSEYAFRPEFQLQDAAGRTVTQDDFRGRFLLVVFGYTRCPEATPTTLARVGDVLEGLGWDADEVQALFISVDPDRDDPSEVAAYAAAFHPSILGLTGSPEVIRATASELGILYQRHDKPDEPGGYVMEHSTRLLLIGPGGAWRRTFDHDTPADEILADLSSRL